MGNGAEHEEEHWALVGLAIEAGVLQTCQYHEDIVYEKSSDRRPAYRLASAQFKAGQWPGLSTQKALTDALDIAILDNCADECSRCEKWWDD